jgi:hypothetical protein
MKDLKLDATDYTLKIDFETGGKLFLGGISIPENIINFNKTINDWVDEFIKTSPTTIEFTFDVEYLNTATTRVIMTFLKKIKSYCDSSNASLAVVWYYEDEDVLELGEEFSEVVDLKFSFIPKPILN